MKIMPAYKKRLFAAIAIPLVCFAVALAGAFVWISTPANYFPPYNLSKKEGPRGVVTDRLSLAPTRIEDEVGSWTLVVIDMLQGDPTTSCIAEPSRNLKAIHYLMDRLRPAGVKFWFVDVFHVDRAIHQGMSRTNYKAVCNGYAYDRVLSVGVQRRVGKYQHGVDVLDFEQTERRLYEQWFKHVFWVDKSNRLRDPEAKIALEHVRITPIFMILDPDGDVRFAGRNVTAFELYAMMKTLQGATDDLPQLQTANLRSLNLHFAEGVSRMASAFSGVFGIISGVLLLGAFLWMTAHIWETPK